MPGKRWTARGDLGHPSSSGSIGRLETERRSFSPQGDEDTQDASPLPPSPAPCRLRCPPAVSRGRRGPRRAAARSSARLRAPAVGGPRPSPSAGRALPGAGRRA